MARCKQELCPNWMGDHLCPCAALDGDPDATEDMAAWVDAGIDEQLQGEH